MDQKKALVDYRRAVGLRLSLARKNAGLTQSEAADQLTRRGFSARGGEPIQPSRIGNYEQGSRMPDMVMLIELCRIYGVFPSVILDLDEAPRNKDEVKLMKRYRQTDDRGRIAMQSVAESQPAYNDESQSKDQAI